MKNNSRLTVVVFTALLTLTAGASAASLTVKRLPGSYGAIEYGRNGTIPSTAQATFKANWSITQEENGPSLTCLAVATSLGTPKIILSFAGSSDLGRPKGGYPDSEWSMHCFGNFDRFQNTTGSNYQFRIDSNKPGVADAEVYLLNADKLKSGGDDPAVFKSAIIAEDDLALNFPSRCRDTHFLDPPRCSKKKVFGRFEASLDAAPTLGKPSDPFYVNSLAAGSGSFEIHVESSSSYEVRSAAGQFGFRELFFPTDNQELLFTVSAKDSDRYSQDAKGRHVGLHIVVSESNTASCPVGEEGELDLSQGRGKRQDQIGITVCDIRQLYVARSKSDNRVDVVIGKPKRSGAR